MTTYYQKAISANAYRNAGGTVLNGGNLNPGQPVTGRIGNMSNNLSLNTNAYRVGDISGRIQMPTGVASSGNIGAIKPLPGSASFGKNTKGAYVAMVVGTTIAGTANTILRSPSNDGIKKQGFTLTPTYRYQILNILSWDYVTGRATKGGNAGSGITLANDSGAMPTDAVPGHLFYLYGAPLAKVDNYKPRTNS